MEVVWADVGAGAWWCGARHPSPVSRCEWEQVRATHSAHLSGGRDNLLGVGGDLLCRPDWPRTGCLHQAVLKLKRDRCTCLCLLGAGVIHVDTNT